MTGLSWLLYWSSSKPAQTTDSSLALLDDVSTDEELLDEARVERLSREFYARGTVHPRDAETLTVLRKRMPYPSAALDALYYRVLRDVVLIEGMIGHERTMWLRELLLRQGQVDATQKQILVDLHTEARRICPAFQKLLDECLGH